MAQLSQLLLFDPDPSGLDTLSYGFEKDGCSVTATSDANKARDLIQSASPALVVVNFRDAEQIGLDLLRSTTSNPRTRNVPCVAIGRNEFRAGALGAGAFVFLSVPLFVRDVLGACRLVVAASIPGSRPSPDADLSLTMADVDGVYFLVRSMAVTGRSSAVELRHGTGRGDLRFIDGTLTSAQLGPVQGLPALHRMLLWQTASLKLHFKNVVRRGSQLSMKSSEVIEECDRFLRDFAHEVRDLGFVHTVYRANSARASASEGLPSESVPVLKLFDGHNDLGQVLEASPFRIFDTLKIVKRFVAADAIVAITAPPSIVPDLGPTVTGPTALDFWFQRPSSNVGLGPEVGVGRRAEALRAAAKQAAVATAAPAGGGRPSSPFVAVASGPLAARPEPSTPRPTVRPSLSLRPRTATKNTVVEPTTAAHDAAEDMVTPPPVVAPPSASTPPATAAPSAPREAPQAVPLATDRTPTPAPTATPAAVPASTPALAAGATPARTAAGTPTKPAPAVATGEIRSVASTARMTGSVPVAGSPTVLIDIASLPAPVAMASTEPPPVTALPSPPSVIIAPLTPAPAVTPRARRATPTPGAVESNNKRSPSDNFNALEADFFDREADLYKRDSVENFDDLDKGKTKGSNGRPGRKR